MSTNANNVRKTIPVVTPDIAIGLNDSELVERQDNGYVNKYTINKTKSYFRICVENIFNFCNSVTILLIILMIATGNISDTLSSCIIFLNIGIGIFQEIKAKWTVQKLSLIVENSCTVIRNGIKSVIPTKELVRDDVYVITAGMQIPVDSLLVEGFIEVDESILTGESAPQKREVGEKLLAGSFALVGEVTVRATAVGKDCYIQSVAKEMRKVTKPKSYIFNALDKIIKVISIILIPLGIGTFLTSILGEKLGFGESVQDMAGAVLAMLPIGMFLLTSAALAAGIIRLSKKNTLLQDLYSIEMLAMVDTLLLDKTGTITTGELQVASSLQINEDALPYENIITALLKATKDKNVTAMALSKFYSNDFELAAVDILPFSSGRKFSAVQFEQYGAYCIGAPDYIVDMNEELEQYVSNNSIVGKRTLILAKAKVESLYDINKSNTIPLLAITLDDTIRSDAKQTLDWFRENDVDIRIISGDDPRTVSEIAKQTGVENADQYVNCSSLTADELRQKTKDTKVFGRVSPEQKCDILKELQAQGHVVGMVGDGVNDVRALKEADCSISFASANEVARNISRIVMLDNNFSSIPAVVLEGRRAINNVQSVASLYIMKNIFAIFISLLFICMQQTYPFNPSQMLLIEFFVLGIPSFCLALQPNKKRVKGNFISNVMTECFPAGIALIIGVLLLFGLNRWVWHFDAENVINTMGIFALTLSGFVILFTLCMPFTKFRLVVCIGSLVLCLVAVPLVWLINGSGFISEDVFSFRLEKLSTIQYAYMLIGVAVSTGSYLLLKAVSKIALNKMHQKKALQRAQ